MKQSAKHFKSTFRILGILLALLPFAFYLFPSTILLPSAKAHRYHTSLTRMDYNEKEKLVEISLQLFTHDLVPILEQKAKKRVDLEKTPEVDKLILDYLNENFVLRNKNGEAQTLRWVGKEIEVDVARIYVEVPETESLAGANLQNTLFFESFPEQTNLVIARFDGKKADLLFRVGDKFKEIKENPPKE
jgi:hypothetical protein